MARIRIGLLAWCSIIGLHCAPQEDAASRYEPPEPPIRPWFGPPNAGLTADAGTVRAWPGAPCPTPGPPLAPDSAPEATVETFDPREVYMLSRLEATGCRVMIAPAFHPDRVVAGAACGFFGLKIRPSDHRLFYLDEADRLGAFRCDDCPEDAAALPASRCPSPADPLYRFLFAPDGSHVQECAAGKWYDAQGAPLRFEGGRPVHLGWRRTALTSDGVLDMATGTDLKFYGISPEFALGVRARDDGYWVATVGFDGPGLWHVNFDATRQLEGRYPALPADQIVGGGARIDAEGRLIQVTGDRDEWNLINIWCSAIDGENVILSQLYPDPDGVEGTGFQALFTGP